MTKQIAITALTFGAIILGTNNVQAQNTTATTTVNITLNDVSPLTQEVLPLVVQLPLTMLLQQTITLIRPLLKPTL
jgi:hypothetical protein